MRGSAIVFAWFALAAAGCEASSEPSVTPDAAAPAAKLPSLGLNDVSVLLPVPSSPSAPGYLGPTSAGERGELLPMAVYDAIPPFPVVPKQGLDYTRLRAVAVRFDGCFRHPQSDCEAQIRLVMQPITDKGDTRDSAVHLFYKLSDAELPGLVRELRRLRSLAPEVADGPLDVHAGFAAQGGEGPYATALNALVLRLAGEQNFIRMTFFLRAPPTHGVWFFGGFDRKDGVLAQLDIVGVGKSNQRVILTPSDGGYSFDFLPVEKAPEDTSLLLSSDGAKAASREALEKALGAFARIENPAKYSPDDLPCAGCHVSAAVTGYAKQNLQAELSKMPDAFTSTRDLSLRGGASGFTSSLRAFGWFGKNAMISQRVVNESAAVVDDFEKRFPEK